MLRRRRKMESNNVFEPLANATDKEITSKWEDFGILKGYKEETKEKLAKSLENLVSYYASSQKDISSHAVSLFPILCQVVSETGREISPEKFMSLVYASVLEGRECQEDRLNNMTPEEMVETGSHIIQTVNAETARN